VFQAVKTVRRHRPQLVQNIVSSLLKLHVEEFWIGYYHISHNQKVLIGFLKVLDFIFKFYNENVILDC
jgi:hypothetical protein